MKGGTEYKNLLISIQQHYNKITTLEKNIKHRDFLRKMH